MASQRYVKPAALKAFSSERSRQARVAMRNRTPTRSLWGSSLFSIANIGLPIRSIGDLRAGQARLISGVFICIITNFLVISLLLRKYRTINGTTSARGSWLESGSITIRATLLAELMMHGIRFVFREDCRSGCFSGRRVALRPDLKTTS